MAYTVKQLSNIAGVSVRTLHFYDQIGLLTPSRNVDNGYRRYGEQEMVRLQQILFYRELGLSLGDIKAIMDRPGFDVLDALGEHRKALHERVDRLNALIQTIDTTMSHLKGEIEMSTKQLFEGFSEETQKQYEEEIRARYDMKTFDGSIKRWGSYTPEQKEKVKAEGEALYQDILANFDKGPESPEIQAIIGRWHQHLRNFYEPTVEILRGLGQLYTEHPDFQATFRKMDPDMPEFLNKAIAVYCDRLAAK